jgi:SP family general alpha glucoside:H+ symporter-like MFS transporter
VLGLVWSWWRLPETKGRTFAQIDILFRNKTSARKFKGSLPDESRRDVGVSSQV